MASHTPTLMALGCSYLVPHQAGSLSDTLSLKVGTIVVMWAPEKKVVRTI